MRDSRTLMSFLCGLMCTTILTVMLISHALPLWTGTDIYLRVVPVDPRDLFRGDYVVLSYDISWLRPASPASGQAEMVGDTVAMTVSWWDDLESGRLGPWEIMDREVWVRLVSEPDEVPGVPRVYRAVEVTDSYDGSDGIHLRGRIREYSTGNMRIHYGIDALFVQEGAGLDIENAIREGKPVHAIVAVTRSGTGRLRDLVIDGRRVLEDR